MKRGRREGEREWSVRGEEDVEEGGKREEESTRERRLGRNCRTCVSSAFMAHMFLS